MPSCAVTKVQRYQVRFSDGRSCTVLDMNGEDPAAVVEWLKAYFSPGFVLEVVHVA